MSDQAFAAIEIHGSEPTVTRVDPDGVLKLYEGPRLCSCHENWLAEMPMDVKDYLEAKEEDIEKASEHHALTLRMKRVHEDRGKPEMYLHSVTVNSELLTPILLKLFNESPSIKGYVYDELPVFKAPFLHMYYWWDEWKNLLAAETDERTLKHMKLLDDIMTKELAAAFAAKKKADKEQVMVYDQLFAIFKPQCWVRWWDGENERLYRFWWIKYDKSRELWKVQLQYTAWDGESIRSYYEDVKFNKWDGTRKITGNHCFPLEYSQASRELKATLYKRGMKALGLFGVHCVDYHGKAWTQHKEWYREDSPRKFDGRVILDTKEFNEERAVARAHDGYGSKLNDTKSSTSGEVGWVTGPDDQQIWWEDVCRLSPYIRGWSLSQDSWLSLDVSSVRKPAWNADGFSRLSLPADFRELVQATVEMQLKRDSAFDDIIMGKGKGFIMLLSGPPGVGKTATIETVSDALRVPLYVLKASDLGTTPSDVEERLKRQLERASRWKAVVLLDEADIFLERRDSGNLARNAIITIFLRQLEYHRGVICLTTNRPDDLDPAIHSRVHLSLRYPELDAASREAVWRQFVAEYNKESVEVEYEDFSDCESMPAEDGDDEQEDGEDGEDQDADTVRSFGTDGDEADEGEHSADEDEIEDEGSESAAESEAAESEGGSDDDEEADAPRSALVITDAQFKQLASVALDGRQIKNAVKTATLLSEWKDEPLDFNSLSQSVRITEKHMNKPVVG